MYRIKNKRIEMTMIKEMYKSIIKHYIIWELLLVPVGDEIRNCSMEEFLEDSLVKFFPFAVADETKNGSVEEIVVEKLYVGSGGDGDSSISSM